MKKNTGPCTIVIESEIEKNSQAKGGNEEEHCAIVDWLSQLSHSAASRGSDVADRLSAAVGPITPIIRW